MVLTEAQVFIWNFTMFDSFVEDKGKLLYRPTVHGFVKNYRCCIFERDC